MFTEMSRVKVNLILWVLKKTARSQSINCAVLANYQKRERPSIDKFAQFGIALQLVCKVKIR